MPNVDLLAINPVFIENHPPKIEIQFSDVAKWNPTVRFKKQIELSEYLRFVDDCLLHLENPNHIFAEGFLSVDTTLKSTVKVQGGGYSFSIPKTKWKTFVHELIQRLLVEGIITIQEKPKA